MTTTTYNQYHIHFIIVNQMHHCRTKYCFTAKELYNCHTHYCFTAKELYNCHTHYCFTAKQMYNCHFTSVLQPNRCITATPITVLQPKSYITATPITVLQPNRCTVKPAVAVTSIKRDPPLSGHFRVPRTILNANAPLLSVHLSNAASGRRNLPQNAEIESVNGHFPWFDAAV